MKTKKLSETLSPISNCHCQERFLESNSESYEKNVIFPLGPSSNTKGAPDLQTPLLHGITQTEREGVKNSLPSEDGKLISCRSQHVERLQT